MHDVPYYLVGGTESLFEGIEVADIQSAFAERIQSYLPNNPVVWVSLDEVRHGLIHQVSLAKELFGKDTCIITLSQLYFNESEGEVSCTRLVDKNYASLGLSPRPGKESVKNQVNAVMKQAGARPIVVVDDTLFHGDTIGKLLELGLRIDGAVEFFTAIHAANSIRTKGIRVFAAHTLEEYLDVMPLHDFLPALPLSGKLLGEMNGEGAEYIGKEVKMSWSVPYIMPYIRPDLVTKWASIPYDYVHAFSAFAISQAIILAERMKQVGIVTNADIMASQPHHVSMPYLNSLSDPNDMPLHDILRRAVHHSLVS